MKKVIIGGFVLFLIGCASILSGTKQTVTINSNVDGAEIFLDGKKIGVTPFVGDIPKNKKMLKITADGYKDYSAALNKDIDGTFWVNILIGGLLGSSTDMSTGAMYKYAPATFQIDLKSGSVAMNDFKNEVNLRSFAMINMSNIAIDIAKNEGKYLTTLLHLSQLEENEDNVELVRENIIKSNGDQVIFGNLMVTVL